MSIFSITIVSNYYLYYLKIKYVWLLFFILITPKKSG